VRVVHRGAHAGGAGRREAVGGVADEEDRTLGVAGGRLRRVRRILDNRAHAFETHLSAVATHLALPVDEALAVYEALVLPEVYRTLVVERGWSPTRYETWLGDAMVQQLLR